MRKFVLSLAAASAALAVATPAAAQYYPQPQGYGHGYNHGRVDFRQVRALQIRVDQIQRRITQLAQRRIISRNEFRNRQEDARDLERKLHRDARDGRGLNRRELYDIERRIVRLEQRIARDANDGNRWGRRY
jgi:TolA-binding protein